jgi:TldD protein
MLSKTDLEKILILALQNGGDFAEVFLEKENVTSIFYEDNKTEKILIGEERGAGIRIIAGAQIYYASTTKVDFEDLRAAAVSLSEALSPADGGASAESRYKSITLKPKLSTMKYPVLKRPETIPLEEKMSLMESANIVARQFGRVIRQVSIGYRDSNQAVTLANSDGDLIEDQRIRTRFVINVVAAEGRVLQTAHEAPGGTCGFELFDIYDTQNLAQTAAKRALLMLEAPHAPSGAMPVVLASEAGGTMIHEACGHALEADFILRGTSVFAGKIGGKVASDLITVIDDGTLTGNFGTFRFDDDGIPSQRTVLIENGILKNYMCDRYCAMQLKIPPTGNGRRENFRHKSVPRMTNTFIAPGKDSPQEIINSIENGLLVRRMGGGEVDVINGNFVFEVTEGYLIENGKIKHPVRGAILTGNGPEVLQIIDRVGTDLTFMTGVCGKYDHAPVTDGQPTIRIPKIVVGGRE